MREIWLRARDPYRARKLLRQWPGYHRGNLWIYWGRPTESDPLDRLREQYPLHEWREGVCERSGSATSS